MAYQALYRAWRPDSFDGVVGQDKIVTTLKNQIISGRIAHAYLFCGSRGTGKTSMAKLFARAINCVSKDERARPCGVCPVCVELKHENNMDVIEIDAASNNGVDEIRDLREKVKYPPSIGRYKVYIIDEVHMLSTGAFNALLKTLEEPPAHAVFILATTEPQKLPSTILSRCQRFDFKRISTSLIARHLGKIVGSQGAEADERALYAIARTAQGGMRDAISLLDLCLSYAHGKVTEEVALAALGAFSGEFLFGFADALIDDDLARAFELIDQGIGGGRDAATFSREAAAHLRALLLAKFGGENLAELLDVTREDAQAYQAQAERVSNEKLLRMMELFMRAENDMRYFSQPRTMLELCAARCARPELERDLDAIIERVERLEKRLESGAAAKPAEKPKEEKRPEPKPLLKEAPTEAAPPPEAQPAPDSEDLSKWKEALSLIAGESAALMPLVTSAEFAGRDGDQLLLSVPKAKAIYATILFGDAKKKVVEEALQKVYGRAMSIRQVQPGEEAPKKPASKDNLLLAYEVFGRENVIVTDEQ